jgi:uncharacterized Zn finger protein (UPF0148 family)
MPYCVKCYKYSAEHSSTFDLGQCRECRERGGQVAADNEQSEAVVSCYKCGTKLFRSGAYASPEGVIFCGGCAARLSVPQPKAAQGPTAPEKTREEASTAARLEAIRREREADYGDKLTNFRTLGCQITGILEQHYNIKLPHPVPPSIAALILVEVKTNRIARPQAKQDSFDDAVNYINIVEELRREERKAADSLSGSEFGHWQAPEGTPPGPRE